MTDFVRLPADLQAALVLGTPLRDGIELVRARGKGTIVVLGYDESFPIRGGHQVGMPLTPAKIDTASNNDGATIVSADLERVLLEQAVLQPKPVAVESAGGTRHISSWSFAKEIGKAVIVVSDERQTVTVYYREEQYFLTSKDELRRKLDGSMNALRSFRAPVDGAGKEPASHQMTKIKSLLGEVKILLSELGSSEQSVAIECENIATALGVEWTQPNSHPRLFEPVAGAELVPLPSLTATLQHKDFGGSFRPAGVAPPRPQQLPSAPPRFTGRAEELAKLDAILAGDDATPKIALVTGGAGMGKSALVVHCARLVADRFPDGVLYTDLRGFEPAGQPADPAEVLRGLLRDLGVEESSMPRDLDGAIRRYRSCLDGRRYLVVLDNARNADQVRPLVPGSASCGVLVTSRSVLRSLTVREGARVLVLGTIPPDDAVSLLGKAAGGKMDGAAAAELARLCGYHPLALCIAGARAAACSTDELADFISELESELLETLSDTDDATVSVKAAFTVSYDILPPDAQRTFRLLGGYPGPTISQEAAEVLTGDRAGLRKLADAHLLEKVGRRRYRFNDPLRAYAVERAQAEPAENRQVALARLLVWFAETAEEQDRALDHWLLRMQDPVPSAAGHEDPAEAAVWFEHELVNLAAATEAAWNEEEREVAWRLALAPSAYFFSRKPWALWIQIQETGLAAAHSSGAVEAEAWLCDGLGVAYREQSRLEDSFRCFNRALAAFQEVGNRLGEAQAQLHLAQAYREKGELEPALRTATTSIELFGSAGHEHGEARAANLLSGIHLSLDDLPTALSCARRATALFHELGDDHGHAWAVNNMAAVLAKSGKRAEAIEAFRRAETVRRVIDRYGLALTLQGLGDVLTEEGEVGEAQEKYLEALEIFDELDDPRATQARSSLKTTGELASVVGLQTAQSLRRLSDRLAAELDVAASQALDGERGLLSTGLYVPRTAQAQVLAKLRTSDKPVLVQGIAGEGKSSLLWALHEDLVSDPDFDAYLFDSSWLSSGAGSEPRVSIESLTRAAELAHTRGHTPVFLVDTVDLLLHDEHSRQNVLDLCDAAVGVDAKLVLTTRPEEARTLPKGAFEGIVLGPYDDKELTAAVSAHAAVFCTSAPADTLREKVENVVGAAARGLAVREVVVNPLNLRLLFELYAPQFPGLEHDVSSLYEMYWDRRVRTDRRGELAITEAGDLSQTTENTGIALLAAGRLKLGERSLVRSAAAVAAGRADRRDPDQMAVRMDITTLAHRGVLARSGEDLRFFHQTMFEYAASRGLVARDGERGLSFLVEHLQEHPDDLVVGAVAEQALVLAVDDPLCADGAIEILIGMAEAGLPLFQRIALGVLAHRPTLEEITGRLIDLADTAALRRYAQTVPTVAKADPRLQVAMLERVWKRDKSVRKSVLEALERLGARNPNVVITTLRGFECVETALSWANDPAGMVMLVARALVASAAADPEWAREQLFALFDGMIYDKKHRAVPCRIVELIAEYWPVLGSAEAAAALRERILEAQKKHDASASEMRRALGLIQALEWRSRLDANGPDEEQWWSRTLEGVCACLENDRRDVLGNAQLRAIAELIATEALSAAQATRTVARLCRLRGAAPFALNWLFLPLLQRATRGETGAITVVPEITRLLVGLPAPGNNPAEGPPRLAHAAREALREAGLEPRQLTALFPDVPVARQVASWLDDDRLAVLLILAAVGGHPIALAALEQVKADAGVLSPIGQRNVCYDLVPQLDRRPDLLALLVELSVRRQSAQPLAEVVNEVDGGLRARLREHSAALEELIESMFAGKGTSQKEATSLWRRLYRAGAVEAPEYHVLTARFLETPVPAARGNVLELAVDAALDDKLKFDVVDGMLRDKFVLDTVSNAIVSPGTAQADHVAIIARGAWLRLVCRHGRPDKFDTGEVLAIASAAPADVESFAILGDLITWFTRQGAPERAVEILSRVAEAAREQLSAKQENALANRLRSPLRRIFGSAPLDLQRDLVGEAKTLPPTFARILVAAAAQEGFERLRPHLAALLTDELPPGVAQQIHDDIRVRSRESARSALPVLISPIPG
ncbi:tetratricopeptide repeat protein [Amycolatopsis sp. TNS106]|uniref:tetratricopeptide repeat protein n=1 Tax=Amycolatopsis sp. TNS106 TaxID=2861750 RepID=UPI001C5A4F0E|nr:tetratricopeptide repeat protein [Amycolatopsis sp. TNS106]QXV57786.1 hypothetical protein CVV72_12800 [Amycolatopsis sp. TNS106]